MDQLNEWRFWPPDEHSNPEYRALFDVLSRRLTSVTADANIGSTETALASLNEFVSQAEALQHRIKRKSGLKVASAGSRGRLEIVNWRKYGDDESYCRVEVFTMDDTFETTSMIETEYDVRSGAEDDGDYDATYYVNDNIAVADIMISHDGMRFRISVVLAE